jgi:hypothetical protein
MKEEMPPVLWYSYKSHEPCHSMTLHHSKTNAELIIGYDANIMGEHRQQPQRRKFGGISGKLEPGYC